MLGRLDDLVRRDDTERYCTVILCRLRRRRDGTWQALCASGGHPPALLRVASGDTETVQPGGQVVGLVPDAEFLSLTVDLAPGTTLLLYNDGVTEGRSTEGFFGEGRLRETLETAPAGSRQVVETVLEAALRFQSSRTSDDIACLAVTIGDPSRPSS